MAQAVFAGEKIKKLAPVPAPGLALAFAEFLKFSEDCFMRARPGDAGHRYGQNKEGQNLLVEGHAIRCHKPARGLQGRGQPGNQ
jgi:hypothetical protein